MASHNQESYSRRERLKHSAAATREALQGKNALYATYEALGLAHCDAADKLIREIHKLRQYLRNKTGDDS